MKIQRLIIVGLLILAGGSSYKAVRAQLSPGNFAPAINLSSNGLPDDPPCQADFLNLPLDKFQACFDYWTQHGRSPVTLFAIHSKAGIFMTGSFQPGANRPARGMMTIKAYAQYNDTYKAQGFRPEQVSVLEEVDGPRFTVIWAPIDGAYESYLAMTVAQFEAKAKQMRAAKYLLIDFTSYDNNGTKFTAIWVKKPFDDYVVSVGLSDHDFTLRNLEMLSDCYKLTNVTYYQAGNGENATAAIWEKRSDQWRIFGGDLETFQAAYDKYSSQGFRLRRIRRVFVALYAIWSKP